jgi:hypothetical protein
MMTAFFSFTFTFSFSLRCCSPSAPADTTGLLPGHRALGARNFWRATKWPPAALYRARGAACTRIVMMLVVMLVMLVMLVVMVVKIERKIYTA